MKSFFANVVDTSHTWQHEYINDTDEILSFLSASSASSDDCEYDDYNTDDEYDDYDDDDEEEENGDGDGDDTTNVNVNVNANANVNRNGNAPVPMVIRNEAVVQERRDDVLPIAAAAAQPTLSISNRSRGINDNDNTNTNRNIANNGLNHTQFDEQQRRQRQQHHNIQQREQHEHEPEPILLPQHPNCPQLDRPMILHNLRIMASSSPQLLPHISSSLSSSSTSSTSPATAATTTTTTTTTSARTNNVPTLLLRVALSEEIPLIPSDIDWTLLTSQLKSYPATAIGDVNGAHLLQSILRMDPPLSIVKEALRLYPKSCINMDSFYAACQYTSSSPNSSCYDDDSNYSNPVVQLLIQKTMKARHHEGIRWGMLAFLGDARIRTNHAKYLLASSPEAVVDEEHGMFGVSPLDRMMSGAFIHGEYGEWVEKLKLAIWTAFHFQKRDSAHAECTFGRGVGGGERKQIRVGRNNNNTSSSSNNNNNNNNTHENFYPFHLLVKRLIHKDFKGTHFGPHSFLKTLVACARSHSSQHSQQPLQPPPQSPFHQRDENGNLPLHVILGGKHDTNLGTEGERKLITFLLRKNRESAWTPDGINGKMPLRLSIENGWPCYDIIVGACLKCHCSHHPPPLRPLLSLSSVTTIASSASITTSSGIIPNHPDQNHHRYHPSESILHTILSGPYHQCFYISGARTIIRYILKKFPHAARTPSSDGRLPLHVAIEHGWPCHDLLVNAAPLALETRDVRTKCYPFQIAAFSRLQSSSACYGAVGAFEQHHTEEEEGGDSDGDLLQLNVLYELIRGSPMLLHGLATIISKKEDVTCRAGKSNREEQSIAMDLTLDITSAVSKEDHDVEKVLLDNLPLLEPCKKRKR